MSDEYDPDAAASVGMVMLVAGIALCLIGTIVLAVAAWWVGR